MKLANTSLLIGSVIFLFSCGPAENGQNDAEADNDERTEEKEEKETSLELEGAMEDEAFSLPPLPYKSDALEPYIDWKTMKIHHKRHHMGYVSNLNNAIEDNPEIEGMEVEEVLHNVSDFDNAVRQNSGGHYNHVLFWDVMGPDGGGEPEGEVREAIEEEFGSFEDFRNEFNRASLDLFGAGWSWLSVDEDGELFVSNTPNQDNPLMDIVDERGTPVLGLDLWEHAYYLNYQNERGEYIQNFWNVVDWEAVNERYNAAIEDVEA